METSETPLLAPGSLFAGRYTVESLVGQGGMGAVYRVHDTLLDEAIALKIAARGERFAAKSDFSAPRREVLLARRVTHPNVARVFDLGVADDSLFITMELVPGEALRRQRRRFREPAAAVGLMQQVASGLAAAHDAGVLHLDLKPENILVVPSASSRAVVIDFGIARALGTHASGFGTLDYMAPEQLDDVALDGATDVYAFGLVLYGLLHDRWPFPGHDGMQRLSSRRQRDAEPLPGATPTAISELVMACLARAPRDRPTMRTVEAALTRWLTHGATAATTPAPTTGASVRTRTDVGALPDGIGARLVNARRRLSSPVHVPAALAEIEALLAIVPALDVAIAARAIAAVRMWNLASDDPSTVDRAVAAVAEAIAQAPHLADSHVADALIADATGDMAWAVRALARAIEREPLNVWAHATLARIEIEGGAGGEERALFAAALDPEHVTVLELIARERLLAGRRSAADEMLARLDALPTKGFSTTQLRTRAAVWALDRPALRALAPSVAADGPAIAPLFARAIRIALGEGSAEALVAQGEEILLAAVSPRRRAFLHQLIAEFVARSRPDLALDHVTRAASLSLADLRWFDACPALAQLRSEPAFSVARARVSARVELAVGTARAALAPLPTASLEVSTVVVATDVPGTSETLLPTRRVR
jgi:serine/threonine-protein kinase